MIQSIPSPVVPHVYRRTTKGQAEALSGAQSGLTPEQRRLLLMVNGFTSIDTLADLAGFEAQLEPMTEALKASGLIEEASAPVKRAKLSDLCGSHCH